MTTEQSGNLKKRFLTRQRGPNQIDTEQRTNNYVAFFLGAGASIKAGVPDTFSFVNAFIESMEQKEKEKIQLIIKILEEWGRTQIPPKKVDVELLLLALQTLVNKEQEIVIPFIKNPELKLTNFDASKLLESLRNFIKSKVIVDVDAIKYLDPFLGFIQEFSPLDIYSANYDTCIELFCSENKIDYKDGFDEAWNPDVFEDPILDVRLFKIHGSVTWYQSDRGRFLKIPVKTNLNNIELITKERAEGLMLYPAQKFEYIEPLFELLMQMKERLLQCQTLFVIGYSFRDDHVRRIFWDVARINKEIQMILVGPDSWKIYIERLKYYADGSTLSSLSGRVICLPYLFENVFRFLKTEFFTYIQIARNRLNDLHSNEIAGYQTKWQECLLPLALSGNIEELKIVADKITIEEINESDYEGVITSLIHGLFYSLANQDNNTFATYYLKKLKEVFLLYPGQFNLNINPIQSSLTLSFPPPIKLSPSIINNILQKTYPQIKARALLLKGTNEKINKLLDILFQLQKMMLSLFSNGIISFKDYISTRETSSEVLKDNLKFLSGKGATNTDGIERTPIVYREVVDIERNEVQHILSKLQL